MFRKSCELLIISGIAMSLAAAADAPPPATLSAEEIVEKNVAARGGLEAWRKVQAMTLEGKMGAGGNQRPTLHIPAPGGRRGKPGEQVAPSRPTEEAQLPFVMELKRPRKMRFELQFRGQTALQVYDGANGWKVRPFLNRTEVEPYTDAETKMASMQAELDGPLVDYAAKGTKVELAGAEKVERRDTYKLKLTLKNGEPIHVWIDAATFLEAKIQGQPRKLDGVDHPVEVYFRDYRAVNGLQIPHVLETKVVQVAKNKLGLPDPVVPPERITIEKVTVNPQLEDALFSRPSLGVVANAK